MRELSAGTMVSHNTTRLSNDYDNEVNSVLLFPEEVRNEEP